MTAPGFPAAAHEALGDAQLRHNLRHATTRIRAKRAAVVSELPDWEELREAGAAIKDRALATLPEQLERLEAAVQEAGGVVHWARDGAGANSIVAGIAHAARRTRADQGQVARHRRDRLERRARRRGDRRGGDRPRGADRAARERQPVAHPRACDPQKPRRRSARCSSGRSRRARSSAPTRARSPRPRESTSARSSSPPRLP